MGISSITAMDRRRNLNFARSVTGTKRRNVGNSDEAMLAILMV